MSFIASFTLVVMILISANKLKTPLRRLIFGLSVSDAISSIANVLIPSMMPEGVLASGNQTTCEAVAFSLHFGGIASPLYTLALCIYYLHVIQYNTRDRDFAKRIEPWLHCISIGFPLLGAIVNLAMGMFNNNGFTCWISSQPPRCATIPDAVGECIRGANAEAYKWIFAGMPGTVSFVGIIYVMVVISWTVIQQERRNARHRFQVRQTGEGDRNTRRTSISAHLRMRRSSIVNLFSTGIRESGDNDNTQTYATRGVAASQRRVRNTVTQSLLYIAAFIITYIGYLVITMLEVVNKPAPFPLMVEHYIFTPLAGFFNILVYTRPKVSTVRRRRPEYWWFQAFWLVVKAGGEVPELPPRQQTNTLAPGNHTDVSAMRRRLAATAQPVSIIRDEVINEVSEPLNTTKQLNRGVSFQTEDVMVEQVELALVRREEEEFNVCEVDKRRLSIAHCALDIIL